MSTAELEKRNCGMDVYRVIAILMITLLHLDDQHFGLLNKLQEPGVIEVGFFIKYLCLGGVNCFAIISGYFLGGRAEYYDRRWFVNISSFYCKIVVWYLLLYLICQNILHIGYNFFEREEFDEIIFSPLNEWWYISAYMGVLALMPLINRALKNFSSGELIKLSLVLFVMFSLMPAHLLYSDSMRMGYGYSTIWLLLGFICGTMLRRNQEAIGRIRYIRLIAAVSFILCTVLPYRFHLYALQENMRDPERFFNYTSPFCVLQAVSLFVLCSNIKLRSRVVVQTLAFISMNSLGIYLFQAYRWIWSDIIISNPKPLFSAHELYWRMPYMMLVLVCNGLLCNILMEKFFALLRMKTVTGLLYDQTAGAVARLRSDRRDHIAWLKLLLLGALLIGLFIYTWENRRY